MLLEEELLLLPSLIGCSYVWCFFLQLSTLQETLDLQLFIMWGFERQIKHNLMTFTNLRRTSIESVTNWLHFAIL